MKIITDLFRPNAFTTGLAMFAMFFGSGNLIFPVSVGQMAGEQTVYAIAGLFITAVLMPFATLCLMMLFNGDYDAFFNQIGVIPGKIIAFVILALIGPFGVLPRCIAFSYSTFSIYQDKVSLLEYTFISVVIVFLFSIKTTRVVALIGNFLTPILLVSLAVIIFVGLKAEPMLGPPVLSTGPLSMISSGMIEGYKTFDIFAALFLATAIMPAFNNVLDEQKMVGSKRALLALAIKASLMGMALLLIIYGGLSLVAANLRGALLEVPGDKLLGTISTLTMGSTAGFFSNVVVSFSCLTTAISLAVVSADFFKREVFFGKVSYAASLLLTMIITFIFACLGFDGIMRLVIPILMVLCPAVIALIIATGLKHFFGFSFVKLSFYTVLFMSLVGFLIY